MLPVSASTDPTKESNFQIFADASTRQPSHNPNNSFSRAAFRRPSSTSSTVPQAEQLNAPIWKSLGMHAHAAHYSSSQNLSSCMPFPTQAHRTQRKKKIKEWLQLGTAVSMFSQIREVELNNTTNKLLLRRTCQLCVFKDQEDNREAVFCDICGRSRRPE